MTVKNRVDEPEIVVGLDIGTTKVCAVVGEVDSDGVTILGVGNVPCRGLRKGVVSNIEWTVRSISDAIESAQTMAGVEIRTVYASVGGSHVRGVGSDGVAAVNGGEVARLDVERVLEGARAIPVDADRQILHVLPREFTVDNQDGIRDPVGMSGVRLGVKVNLITAATSCVQNVIRCAERCNLTVADVVLGSLASAEAVLSEDEKEIGVAVVDMGGGTTDLLLYVDGGIAHTSVIPAGGMNVTADIAAGLRTPIGEAERLKRNFGCALGRMVAEDEEIEVPGVGGHMPRKVARRLLGHRRASRRGDLRGGPKAHRRHGPSRAALGRRRSDGRRRPARRHDRLRRGDPRHAGATRRPRGRAGDLPARSGAAVRVRGGARAVRREGARRGSRPRARRTRVSFAAKSAGQVRNHRDRR